MAGAAALRAGGSELAAVILTSDENIPPETAAYLASRSDDPTTIAIGGAAARAFPDVEGPFGATRFETRSWSRSASSRTPRIVGLATGLELRRRAHRWRGHRRVDIGPGPMLLTDRTDLPDVVAEYLAARLGTIDTVVIFGGTAAVAQAVEDEVNDVLGF